MKHVFSFIACTNHARMMEECKWYIDRLYVPEGWRTELITITDARSMAEGYNRAAGLHIGEEMRTKDVPVRIYLHQDVYILNRWFLYNLLAIFESDETIGMIGMAGTPRLDVRGVMWSGSFIGNYYIPTDEPYEEERLTESPSLDTVQCIDGLLMATCVDIPWREDLFDGFDFYDASQCMEFAEQGERIVVPEQKAPWCVHGAGKSLSMYRYNHYRKVFLEHYGEQI